MLCKHPEPTNSNPKIIDSILEFKDNGESELSLGGTVHFKLTVQSNPVN